jgi:virginiamycin B lyase
VRGQTLSLRESQFVEAAYAMGGSTRWIMSKEILPNLVAPIIVFATLVIPVNIVFEAALSFIGVGIKEQTPAWGTMLSRASGLVAFGAAWWYMFFPGLALFITVLGFNLLGDGLRDALDPKTGRTEHTALGEGSAPHGVIVGPDGAPWITDGGLNAIVRVDPASRRVRRFPLPASAGYANLNTATFDRRGVLWFTGQSGIYGRLDPRSGKMRVFRAPRGSGPYGITTTPSGGVYYASLAGSYLGRIDIRRGTATVLRPPTRRQGARRAWSDSRGRIWISEWNAGKLGMYNPRTRRWREWRLPGSNPMPYAVYVDEKDIVWLSDFGSNALVRFNPATSRFTRLRLPTAGADVRQILGRRGEVWGAESGTDKLVVVLTR